MHAKWMNEEMDGLRNAWIIDELIDERMDGEMHG